MASRTDKVTQQRDTAADAERVRRLFERWSAEDPTYDRESWPGIRESLERDRLSRRRLFSQD